MGDEQAAAPLATRVRTHKDLLVWQKAMDLVVEVYRVTANFPPAERYGLISQMRRAAVSVPSNIAEGAARSSRPDYHRFASMALGSLAELETQALLAARLDYSTADQIETLLRDLAEVRRLLCGLLHSLQRPSR
jgi:four helix bundle protein